MLAMLDKLYPPCPLGHGTHGGVKDAASMAFYVSRDVSVRNAPSSQPPACRQHTFHAISHVPSRCRPPDLFLYVPERRLSAAEAKTRMLKKSSRSMTSASSVPPPTLTSARRYARSATLRRPRHARAASPVHVGAHAGRAGARGVAVRARAASREKIRDPAYRLYACVFEGVVLRES